MTFKSCKIALIGAAGVVGISALANAAPTPSECIEEPIQTSFQCGTGADAFAVNSTAVGIDANASGEGSAAFGSNANAEGGHSVAVGENAQAGTSAGGLGAATAIGSGANAMGANSVAVGIGAYAGISDSIAIGNEATVAGASTENFGGVAIGTGAKVDNVPNSVALGSNSIADQANTVSVGFVGGERKIVNVAAGVDDTDAVNMSQLNATNQTVAAQGTQVAANTAQIAAHDNQISTLQTVTGNHENRITALEQLGASFDLLGGRLDSIELRNLKQDKGIRRANEGVAMALAMDTPVLLPGERIAVTGGLGFWNDRVAGAASMGFRVTDHASMSIGVGIAPKSGKAGGKVGFRMGW